MADNVTLNAGSGGATMRTVSDSSGDEWIPSVVVYATSTTPGAATFQFVNTTNGLPVSVVGTVPVSGTVSITGSVAVTGTFFQATQPISGTVTASAGTNLNTSALALESGGNLASLNTKTPSLGQALAASSTPVVLPATQITALTPLSTVATTQSGTWTNTVTQATAASLNATVVGTGTFSVQNTAALPAGTNLVGSIAEGPQIASAFNGVTGLTVQYANFSTSSSGATVVVAAVSGKKVYVLRWSVSSNGATNVNLQSHTTTTLATGTRFLTQFASGGGAYCPLGIIATASGESLDVNNSAAVAISGEVTYVQF
jgi:large repetitive protein